MSHPSREFRPNDEQDPCGEAVRMTQALIADGIDPAALARAFRSRLLFFLVGTVATTDLAARWTDDPSLSSWEHASSAAEDQRPLAAQFEPRRAKSIGRAAVNRWRPIPVQEPHGLGAHARTRSEAGIPHQQRQGLQRR